MPLFSVIVPTFNRQLLLRETLASISSQRLEDYEVIVVDDGSTDATLDYLKSLPNLKVLLQSNRGSGSARNLGARNATGQYLAFLDSDDLWFPWSLEVYRDVIQEHNYPSLITGEPYVFSNNDKLDTPRFEAVKSEGFVDYLTAGGLFWWGGSSFVIRRDAFAAAGGFTDEFINNEDMDLLLRLGVAPGFVHIAAPVTFAYRNHFASAKHNISQTYAGARLMVRAEQKGNYAGGEARATERRRLLTRHTRAVTLWFLRDGRLSEAWMLYLATFVWNASLGRLKYLAGFPLLAVANAKILARDRRSRSVCGITGPS